MIDVTALSVLSGLLAQVPLTPLPPTKVYWNGEINFGHVLVIVSLVGTALGAYYAMKNTINSIGARIDLVCQSIEHLEEAQNERGTSHHARITRLEESSLTLTGILQNLTGRMDGLLPSERRSRPRKL